MLFNTSGLGDFKSDHNNLTPSCLSITLKHHSGHFMWSIIDHTHDIDSISSAQAPNALVTLISSGWLVPVRSCIIGGIPPAFLIVTLLSDSLAHSPIAPTTLINTYKHH